MSMFERMPNAQGMSRLRQSVRKTERAISCMPRENSNFIVTAPARGIRISEGALPPLAAYEAWLGETRSIDPRAHGKIEGRQVRRIAQMRRNGCSWDECSRALARSATALCTLFGKVPEALK